jgi:hypothetical protein
MAEERSGKGEHAGESTGEWHNTSQRCEDDATQTIVNNKLGRKKEVSLTVENRGDCPVLVGTAPQEGDFSGGDNTEIKKGKQRVHIKLPKGHYLMAGCRPSADFGCDWTISDVRP